MTPEKLLMWLLYLVFACLAVWVIVTIVERI